MPGPSQSAGLTITQPLVLYRALLATKKINPDPAQHRLALQLQKLYFRLKDYDPNVEYRQRLDQISRTVGRASTRIEDEQPLPKRSFLASLWGQDARGDGPTLALTRTVPIHESAMTIDSPQGMLLYGEVGRGKSMLLDLLADCLPSQKKRRWHFNTFMLDTFRKLEELRKERLSIPTGLSGLNQEHSVLTLARDMVSTTPVLFLDEFQLPDRTASKLLSSFLTSFFHLGGVLIATSNRMPEELAKAAGVEYMPEPRSALDNVSSFLGYGSRRGHAELAAATDFGAFLEVLKARCQIWEMEGERDWRREYTPDLRPDEVDVTDKNVAASTSDSSATLIERLSDKVSQYGGKTTPAYYHIIAADSTEAITEAGGSWTEANHKCLSSDGTYVTGTSSWEPGILHVYGRQVLVPAQCKGVTKWTFNSLCGNTLGPADYITLASTYHTLILDEIPILTTTLRNEARRFITLLDALYEAKCRLLIRAAAPPDQLFFPDVRTSSISSEGDGETTPDSDEVYQETLAEIYQDATNPFRPNISVYDETNAGAPSAAGRERRSVLADEDADFGPVYGNGRGHGASTGDAGLAETERRQDGPDFTRTTLLTGEDERFAYKRARSRLWEMCGERWWNDRAGHVDTWWKPLSRSMRHWEGAEEIAKMADKFTISSAEMSEFSDTTSSTPTEQSRQDRLFRHGASPFRTRQDPPPKFSWVHAWGLMQWGKKAGEWGRGVEGKRKSGDCVQKD